ncbi:hypothetical protein, partial [Pseudomonas amygdali]|uniref:hypothetical protein n=1 Tax=Pseudomonas amygdali TaxID=47877 RepID=UPI001CB95328
EKSFLPTSTPRWHHAEGTFFGGLPCIGIIEIPIHERLPLLERVDVNLAKLSPRARGVTPEAV